MIRLIDYCKAIIAVIGLIITIILLPACTEVKYKPIQLTHDPRPLLPKVKEVELQCLSQSAYQRLYDRERLMAEYCTTLETIIDNTKGD